MNRFREIFLRERERRGFPDAYSGSSLIADLGRVEILLTTLLRQEALPIGLGSRGFGCQGKTLKFLK